MARWTDALAAPFRRLPRLVRQAPLDVPPVLPVETALARLSTQARSDFAARRETSTFIAGSTHERPLTWDDVEASLEATLDTYRHASRTLVLQLGVEVQKPTPWWRHIGLGLDEYLDRTPARPARGQGQWPGVGAGLDDLVFADLYLLPGQYPRWSQESLGNVRRAYNVSTAFATAPDVPLRWESRVRIVQVTAALEQQRSAHITALQAAAAADGESGYRAFDMWHDRHGQTVFMTPALGRDVLRARSTAELADGLVRRIPWLTDPALTEQRLRETLAVPVAPPAIRR
ncbi:hypothetical protein [Curtobacterium sp. PhB115]|uniref:hypothetical protein n=1 Tax=Curtobacterium sp. PhB115 TaxID=2485173 RepID=UPI000F4B58CE|nr:hypothetical protein [Curtobacterium sp. PhB115]ROP66895.1 hypothetical protein EDF19_2237 [Curtobacterium sp. PhB115]